jgi:hypothetical protein
MHYRDNEHDRRLDNIEDGVGESAEKRTPDLLVNKRIQPGILEYDGVNAFELYSESHRQIRRDIAKPCHRLANIRVSLT